MPPPDAALVMLCVRYRGVTWHPEEDTPRWLQVRSVPRGDSRTIATILDARLQADDLLPVTSSALQASPPVANLGAAATTVIHAAMHVVTSYVASDDDVMAGVAVVVLIGGGAFCCSAFSLVHVCDPGC
jgi:hypothetical protein